MNIKISSKSKINEMLKIEDKRNSCVMDYSDFVDILYVIYKDIEKIKSVLKIE